MRGHSKGTAGSAVSLVLSLVLAVLLLIMAVGASPKPVLPPDAQPVAVNVPAETPRAPDLGVVYLPPPPRPAAAPAAAVARVQPLPPAVEPAPTPPEPAPPAPSESPPPDEPPAVAQDVAPEVAPAPSIPEVAPKVAIVRADPPPTPEVLPPPVEITPEAVREGRALLRLLELGEGPDIEIAWPAAATERADLYRLFRKCFGMQTIVMTDAGEMFDATGDVSTAGAFNGDRYSGFVRQPAGGLSADERAQVAAIRQRHGVQQGRVLRLFPRRVDAILVGALYRIAGGSFDKGVRIRARYSAVDTGVQVVDIQVDGRATTEKIVLPYDAQRTCRAGSAR